MTEFYKAGEHVKIVISDSFYDEDAGEQTGFIGTVVEGRVGGQVYVTFPHTGDKQFYYVGSEIERAPGTTPLPEPLKIGDWVKVENYNTTWDGTVGQITEVRSAGVSITDNKNNQRLSFPLSRVVRTEAPIPAAKYANGDWVKVTGYSDGKWEDTKGKVTIVSSYRNGCYSYVIEPVDGKPYLSGGFDEKYLKATTAPRVDKFKAGDWVEIQNCCNMDTCNGTTWEVVEVRGEGSYYKLKNDRGNTSSYSERNLKLATKPEKFNAGDWVKVVGRNDKYDGIVGQIDAKEWGKFWRVSGTDGESYQFAEDKLQPTVKPAPKPKFAVGDLVTFAEKNNECWQGGKALVIEVRPNRTIESYKLEIIEGPPRNTIYTKAGMTVNANDSWLAPFTTKFAVGDWVEIVNWSGSVNGTKVQVKTVPFAGSAYYAFENKPVSFGFTERHLKATTAPEPEHWTVSKPIGTTAQATYNDGGTNRVMVKTAADNWLHLYQNADGKVTVTGNRNNQRTKILFGSDRNIKWVVAE